MMYNNGNITGETIDDINDVIRRNDFVNRVLSMIRRDIENDGGTIVNAGGIEMTGGIETNGYASFVNAGVLMMNSWTHCLQRMYSMFHMSTLKSDIELISLIFMRLMRLQI